MVDENLNSSLAPYVNTAWLGEDIRRLERPKAP